MRAADSPARDAAMIRDRRAFTDFEGGAAVWPASDIGADECHVVTLPPPPPRRPRPTWSRARCPTPPASVRRGGHFTVTDTVKNQGGGTSAGPSVRPAFLSSDPVKSASDRALPPIAAAVPALAAGASSTGSVSVHVPAGTPRGTYFLLACHGPDGRRERSRVTATTAVRR